jgi:hypothetical protein
MEIYTMAYTMAAFEGSDLAAVLLTIAGLVGGGVLAWALVGAAIGLMFGKKK